MEFLWSCCGQCGVSSVSDSSLFQLVLVLRVYRPLQCLVHVNYRVLCCCNCHFQSGSLFFILASSVCKSLQCLISTLTQGGEGGHLFRLTCSVVLWGRGHCKQTLLACVGSARSVGTTLHLTLLRHSVLPRSTLLRLEGALQGRCPKWALSFVRFPGLSYSGSQVLCNSTD